MQPTVFEVRGGVTRKFRKFPTHGHAHLPKHLECMFIPCFLVIKDWSVSAPYSHLAGGMKYYNGKLTVPSPGRYYIYAQINYHNNVRVFVNVNSRAIIMINPPISSVNRGSLYAGGVFYLKAGDEITLSISSYNYATIYMAALHSYFGAFLI